MPKLFMDTGDLIAFGGALIALAVGGASVLFTALERRTRIIEVELLRRQVAGQEEDREAQKRSNLFAAHGSISGGSMYDQHEIIVLNGGPAIARAVDVWLHDDVNGADLSEPSRLATTMRKDEAKTTTLNVQRVYSRRGGLTVWARWRDDAGTHSEELIPLHKHG